MVGVGVGRCGVQVLLAVVDVDFGDLVLKLVVCGCSWRLNKRMVLKMVIWRLTRLLVFEVSWWLVLFKNIVGARVGGCCVKNKRLWC